jgi:hypothetical protein
LLKEININIESFLKSGLTIQEYVICWLIHKKESNLLNKIVDPFFELDCYIDLESRGYLKLNGDKISEYEVRQKFLNILKLSENEAKVAEVDSWINEYRELFKGKKPGSMGDRDGVLRKMKKFLETYSEYTKEQILTATKFYIQTQAPSYKYLMQADYLISKEDGIGGVKSKLLSTLDEMKDGGFAINKDLTKEI